MCFVYYTVKPTVQSKLKLTKKFIKTETVTITKTQEVSVVDDGKKEVGILIWQLIKKYLLRFVGKGEKDNG